MKKALIVGVSALSLLWASFAGVAVAEPSESPQAPGSDGTETTAPASDGDDSTPSSSNDSDDGSTLEDAQQPDSDGDDQSANEDVNTVEDAVQNMVEELVEERSAKGHDHGTGWDPTAYDTCPKSLHDQYTVIGPDGEEYETWHPPTAVNPETGQKCTFGHEHGDDPQSSDIYDWMRAKLAAPGHEDEAGVPFGWLNHQSTVYAATQDGAVAHRHEDHVGHKVIVANNVKLVAANPRGFVRDQNGSPIECDYLIKVHQGSHSPDATKNNAHELIYGARCTDGTEVVVSTISMFGQPNQFTSNCDDSVVQTSGSDLPGQGEGARRIPTSSCLDKWASNSSSQHADMWALYEVWEAVTDIKDSGGSSIVRFDPWFGVRNPSRYYDKASGTAKASAEWKENSNSPRGWPWLNVPAGIDKNSPDSILNGARRDFYVQNTTVTNSGPTTFYTDPYGRNYSTRPFEGAIKQYVSQTDNTSLPTLERRNFGLSTNYGPAGSGVHAPN